MFEIFGPIFEQNVTINFEPIFKQNANFGPIFEKSAYFGPKISNILLRVNELTIRLKSNHALLRHLCF